MKREFEALSEDEYQIWMDVINQVIDRETNISQDGREDMKLKLHQMKAIHKGTWLFLVASEKISKQNFNKKKP